MNFQKSEYFISVALTSQLPQSTRPEIVFSGRSNVGKSSLINALLNRKSLARTSSLPGKTTTINYYVIDETAHFVDLPGYGFARRSDQEKKRWQALINGYLSDDRDIRLVLQLVDLKVGPTIDDKKMIHYLIENELPFLIVATKSDKLSKTAALNQIEKIKNEFNDLENLMILPFSSLSKNGRQELIDIIEEVVLDTEA